MAEPTYDEVLKASLNSKLLLYRQLISSFMIKFLCNVEVKLTMAMSCADNHNNRIKPRDGEVPLPFPQFQALYVPTQWPSYEPLPPLPSL